MHGYFDFKVLVDIRFSRGQSQTYSKEERPCLSKYWKGKIYSPYCEISQQRITLSSIVFLRIISLFLSQCMNLYQFDTTEPFGKILQNVDFQTVVFWASYYPLPQEESLSKMPRVNPVMDCRPIKREYSKISVADSSFKCHRLARAQPHARISDT